MNNMHSTTSTRLSVFRSPQAEAQYFAAYEAVLQQWPVPYEEIYIPTYFGDTHVIASGLLANPPLILLHSSGSSAVQWLQNVGPFSQRYRVYAIDIIGEEGKSFVTHPIRGNFRQNFAKWIEEVMDGLHIGRASMIGNSLGGCLVFNTAVYLPERVTKMVLISPAATFIQMWAFYFNLLIPRGIYLSAPSWLSDRLHLVRLANRGFDWIWQGFPLDECSARLRTIRNKEGFPRNRIFPPVYTVEELRKIHIPTLLLIGDHEVIYSPEQVIRRVTSQISNLQAEMIPNANHNAQVTAPEIVNAKILEFLAT